MKTGHHGESEKDRCPNCGSSPMRFLFSGKDLYFKMPGEFHSSQCEACGLMACFPRLSRVEMEPYYPPIFYGNDLLKGPPQRKDLRSWWFRQDVKKKHAAIKKYKTRGRLLDIGCSTGNFLHGMDLTGFWEVYGLEPSRHAVEYINTWYRFPVFPGPLEENHLPSHYFDVVTLWHVFEHMLDPQKSLSAIRNLLKPDGLLVVELPNPDSLDAKVFGSAWIGYDMPRHYHTFPARTFKEIAAQAGYRVLEVKSCTLHPMGSLILSLKRKFGRRLEGTLLKSGLRILGSGPVGLLTLPLCGILKHLGYVPSLSYFMVPHN